MWVPDLTLTLSFPLPWPRDSFDIDEGIYRNVLEHAALVDMSITLWVIPHLRLFMVCSTLLIDIMVVVESMSTLG